MSPIGCNLGPSVTGRYIVVVSDVKNNVRELVKSTASHRLLLLQAKLRICRSLRLPHSRITIQVKETTVSWTMTNNGADVWSELKVGGFSLFQP